LVVLQAIIFPCTQAVVVVKDSTPTLMNKRFLMMLVAVAITTPNNIA